MPRGFESGAALPGPGPGPRHGAAADRASALQSRRRFAGLGSRRAVPRRRLRRLPGLGAAAPSARRCCCRGRRVRLSGSSAAISSTATPIRASPPGPRRRLPLGARALWRPHRHDEHPPVPALRNRPLEPGPVHRRTSAPTAASSPPRPAAVWRRLLDAGHYDYVIATRDRIEPGKPAYPPRPAGPKVPAPPSSSASPPRSSSSSPAPWIHRLLTPRRRTGGALR